jgi:hypothetical protein
MPPALSFLVIFEMGVAFAQEGLDIDPLILASTITGVTGMCHYAQLFSLERVAHHLFFFCPGWPQTLILSISASK